MAVLRKIVIRDFRNIRLQELEFSPNVNCITGGNGEGKTNLLDAVHYLSLTKSAFASNDRYNFSHGAKSFAVSGTYDMPNGTVSRFSVQAESGSPKIVKRDDKQYSRLADHIGVLPVVLISPSDISMVSESGEERRRFVNSVLSQMNPEYLSDVQNYSRLLMQRNMMLRNGTSDDMLYDTLEGMMDGIAARICAGRSEFVRGIEPRVSEWYSRVSGGRETVGLEYRSDLSKGSLKDILAASRDRDKCLGYTSEGVQRDDFIFTMDSYPIRRCGSQGQQKSFVVAVKLAQYSLMKEQSGLNPILLMDDLFDKLDLNRVQNLLEMVSGDGFGQIFITDSNKVRIGAIVDSIKGDRAFFEARSGEYARIDGQ